MVRVIDGISGTRYLYDSIADIDKHLTHLVAQLSHPRFEIDGKFHDLTDAHREDCNRLLDARNQLAG